MATMTQKEFIEKMKEFIGKVLKNERVPEENYTSHLATALAAIVLSYPEALKARGKDDRAHFWRIFSGAGVGKTMSAGDVASKLMYLHAFTKEMIESGKINDEIKNLIANVAKEVFKPYFRVAGLEDKIDWNKWTENFIDGVKAYGTSSNIGNIANVANLKSASDIANEVLEIPSFKRSFIRVNEKGQVVPVSVMEVLPPIAIIDSALIKTPDYDLGGYLEFLTGVGRFGIPYAVLIETENPDDIVYEKFYEVIKDNPVRISRSGIPIEVRGNAGEEFAPINETTLGRLAEDLHIANILNLIGRAIEGDELARNKLIDMRTGRIDRDTAEKEVDDLINMLKEENVSEAFKNAPDAVQEVAINDKLRAKFAHDDYRESGIMGSLGLLIGTGKSGMLEKFIESLGFNFELKAIGETDEVINALASFLFSGDDSLLQELEKKGAELLKKNEQKLVEKKQKQELLLEKIKNAGKELWGNFFKDFTGEFRDRLKDVLTNLNIENEKVKPLKFDKRLLNAQIVGDIGQFGNEGLRVGNIEISKEFFERDRRFKQLKEVYEGIKKSMKDEESAKEVMIELLKGITSFTPAGFLIGSVLGILKENNLK